MTVDQHGTASWWGHEARYRMAAGWCQPGDRVLDAACGIGYGAALLNPRRDVGYVGVDRRLDLAAGATSFGKFIEADLDGWEPPGSFDVAVCFETLEHLSDPAGWLAELCAHTLRCLIVSVPTVPTVAVNRWHLHDFTVDTIPDLVEQTDPSWRLRQRFDQPAEVSAVWIYTR